jgi:hypothetical protein
MVMPDLTMLWGDGNLFKIKSRYNEDLNMKFEAFAPVTFTI